MIILDFQQMVLAPWLKNQLIIVTVIKEKYATFSNIKQLEPATFDHWDLDKKLILVSNKAIILIHSAPALHLALY